MGPGYTTLHDHASSVLALARTLREGLDLSVEMTPVRTASLKLILDTLIDAGRPVQAPPRQDGRVVSTFNQVPPGGLNGR